MGPCKTSGKAKTHHSPVAVLPSSRSTTLSSGRPSFRPVVELLDTAASNFRAVWQSIQLSGTDAGGSAIRIRTGVRSPEEPAVGRSTSGSEPQHTQICETTTHRVVCIDAPAQAQAPVVLQDIHRRPRAAHRDASPTDSLASRSSTPPCLRFFLALPTTQRFQ